MNLLGCFSVIIATLNRPLTLKRALESLLNQTLLPAEIIIVDQSIDVSTKDVVDSFSSYCEKFGIALVYQKLEKAGLPYARNVGATIAKSEYLTYLDDDVVLDQFYLAEIHNGIIKHGALVLQGKILNYYGCFNRGQSAFRTLFLLTRFTKHDGDVTSAAGNCLPVQFDRDIACMWASGCNHTVKRELVLSFKYDENLIAYALGEDFDLTYRINHKYPRTIWAIPTACILHLDTPTARMSNEKLIFMEAVHRQYLFRKNIQQNWLSEVKFCWSRFGYILLGMLSLLKSRNLFFCKSKRLWTMIKAEHFSWKNKASIARFDLSFFHQWFNR